MVRFRRGAALSDTPVAPIAAFSGGVTSDRSDGAVENPVAARLGPDDETAKTLQKNGGKGGSGSGAPAAKNPRRRRWNWFGGAKNRRLRGHVGRPPGAAADAGAATENAAEDPAKAAQALRTAQARKRGLRVAGTVLALVGCAVGGTALFRYSRRWLTHSPHFALREIRVSPTAHLSAAAIRARSGLTLGDNLFAMDLGAALRRVQGEPWLSSVEIRRELPSVVAIDVVEREPACVVALNSLYLADRRGDVFKRANPDEAAAFPVITGVTRDGYVQDREASQGLLREGLAALELWRGDGSARPPVGEVHVDPAAGTTLYTRKDALGIRVGRGAPSLVSARIARVDAVLRSLTDGAERPALVLADQGGDRVTVRLAARDPAPASRLAPAAQAAPQPGPQAAPQISPALAPQIPPQISPPPAPQIPHQISPAPAPQIPHQISPQIPPRIPPSKSSSAPPSTRPISPAAAGHSPSEQGLRVRSADQKNGKN